MFIKDQRKRLIYGFLLLGSIVIGGSNLLLSSKEDSNHQTTSPVAAIQKHPIQQSQTLHSPLSTTRAPQKTAEPETFSSPSINAATASPTVDIASPLLSSLSEARINGDPRTPPIVRTDVEREMPTMEELADPDLYQEYEVRQNQKVYRSFYSASKQKLKTMEDLVSKAREQGVSEEQLREGEEKISKMKAMRARLENEYDDLAIIPNV